MDERELVFYKLLQGTMPFSRGAPPACGGICKLSGRLKPGCTSIFGRFPSNRLLRAIANKLLNHCKILPPTLNKAAMPDCHRDQSKKPTTFDRGKVKYDKTNPFPQASMDYSPFARSVKGPWSILLGCPPFDRLRVTPRDHPSTSASSV